MTSKSTDLLRRRLREERLARETDILRTCGEIAAVLKTTPKTIRNRYIPAGLPVRRFTKAGKGVVLSASRQEVIDWFFKTHLPTGEANLTEDRLKALMASVENIVKRIDKALSITLAPAQAVSELNVTRTVLRKALEKAAA